MISPLFSSKISNPISAVATPEMAIGKITADRSTGRAGRAEFSSTAAARPIPIDSGVTSTVNSTVFTAERQNSGSPTSRT